MDLIGTIGLAVGFVYLILLTTYSGFKTSRLNLFFRTSFIIFIIVQLISNFQKYGNITGNTSLTGLFWLLLGIALAIIPPKFFNFDTKYASDPLSIKIKKILIIYFGETILLTLIIILPLILKIQQSFASDIESTFYILLIPFFVNLSLGFSWIKDNQAGRIIYALILAFGITPLVLLTAFRLTEKLLYG